VIPPNVEATKSQAIQIDTTPPATTAACNGAACVAWYNATVSVTLSASDDASGVGMTVYTTDGTDPQAYNGTTYVGAFSVAQTTTVKYRSWDVAGNAEAVNTLTISIDTVPPSATVACNLAPCNSSWGTTPVKVSFNYTAAGGGAPKGGVKYTTDGTNPCSSGTAVTYSGTPVSIAQVTTINYSAFDVAGNFETAQSQTLYVDSQPPTGVAIMSPLDGGTYNAAAGYIAIVPTGADNIGIVRYSYYRDCLADGGGVYLGSRTDSSRWSWYWDAGGGLPKGGHGLCVRAFDDAGNSTLSGIVYVNVQ
jgi:hypothetical protein